MTGNLAAVAALSDAPANAANDQRPLKRQAVHIFWFRA